MFLFLAFPLVAPSVFMCIFLISFLLIKITFFVYVFVFMSVFWLIFFKPNRACLQANWLTQGTKTIGHRVKGRQKLASKHPCILAAYQKEGWWVGGEAPSVRFGGAHFHAQHGLWYQILGKRLDSILL